MSITKLKTVGRWGELTNDLTWVGTHLGGRRVITGMLTGLARPGDPEELEASEASVRAIPLPPPAVARIAGTRPGLRQK